MAKVDSVERLITGEKGIWMDLQEKPACCPCLFPPPYFKVGAGGRCGELAG